MSKTPMMSSDPNDLERHILDPNIAKSEAEWWAKSRIEELERIVEFQKKAWTADCAERDEMIVALEKLACLGNGDRYGNSIGNCIAQDALAKVRKP